MVVLHICNGYLGNNLYRCLFRAQQNIDIKNIIYVPINVSSTYNTEQFNSDVIISKCFNKIDRLFFFSKQNKIIADIEKKIDLTQVKVIHAHTLFSGGYAAYKLSVKYNIPYIVAIRSTDVNVFLKYMKHLKSLGIKIMNHAQKVVFLSPSYKNHILSKYANSKCKKLYDNSVVLPNGIDELFLENKQSEKLLGLNHIKMIFVGDICKRKNIETTIKAIALLINKGYKITFNVVGEIIDSSYKQVIDNTEFVNYHPKCPKEQVIQFLRSSDIFVMPSHTETFGLVYAEAMSQGLPVLYTKGQGFDGQFDDGVVGYAVSDKDYMDVADKIELAIKNYDTLSLNCINKVEKFDWKIIAQEYKRIYEELSQ